MSAKKNVDMEYDLEKRVRSYEPIFGTYKVVQNIGAGSYGEVFALKHKSNNEIDDYRALKVISVPSNLNDRNKMLKNLRNASLKSAINEIVGRYQKEIDIMRNLKDSYNIVTYQTHDIIAHPDGEGKDILILMDLMTSLSSILNDEEYPSLNINDVIRIGIDLCNALIDTQKKNVIHRDIKPDNIFMSETGIVKLGDFGIAKIAEMREVSSERGTLVYAAPEIIDRQHLNAKDTRCDIYSLGIVLYELMNGYRLPFLDEKSSYSEIETAFERRRSGERLPPPKLAIDNVRLSEIILKACQHNPDNRYFSAVAMKDDLTVLLNENIPRFIPKAWKFENKELIPVISDPPTEIPKDEPKPTKKSLNIFFRFLHMIKNKKVILSCSAIILLIVSIIGISSIIDNFSDNTNDGETISVNAADIKENDDMFIKAQLSYDLKNYSEAFTSFKILAEKGHANGQYMLGMCYYDGIGTEQDYPTAVEWFTKSAEQGNANAQNMLGTCFYYAYGIPQDYTTASAWFAKSAEQGNANAQNCLGECYHNGKGVSKDHFKAVELYTLAAEQGNTNAQINLGDCYYNTGVYCNMTDFVKAIELYSKAEKKSDAVAQYKLGDCYYNGKGVKKDYAKAIELFNKSIEQGNIDALSGLGKCYYSGNGVTQDYAKAIELFNKGIEQNNAIAQNMLGNCYYYGNEVAQDDAKAVEWYTKSALQGNAIAQYNLGVCYYNGIAITQDYVKAIEWYKKSAEHGYAYAQYKLGDCYYYGTDGITQDYGKSVEWYTKAAEQGYTYSQKRLGELYWYLFDDSTMRDFDKAFEWYMRAAEQGDIEAQNYIGDFYYWGEYNIEKDYKKAVEWYSKIIEQTQVIPLAEDVYHAQVFQLFPSNLDYTYMARISLGICYYEGGYGITQDYVRSFQYFTEADNHEDNAVLAKYHIGLFYENGYGNVEKDMEKAFKYFYDAAKIDDFNSNPNLAACFKIAEYYENGYSVEKDLTKAFEAYRRAAKNGCMPAMVMVGNCYKNGIGVEKDYNAAFDCYMSATQYDEYGEAHYNLANCYYEGIGVEKDQINALELYKKAARMGEPNAQNKLKELNETW